MGVPAPQAKDRPAAGAAVTLKHVSSKKRTSRKGGKSASGLSGNPQRRERQLRERAGTGVLRELADTGVTSRPLPRTSRPEPTWWRESHDRVIEKAREADWPADPLALEILAGEIAGDEFYERMQSEHLGFRPTEWLRKLILHVGGTLSDELQDPAPRDPDALWAFLQGLALISPNLPPEDEPADDVLRQIRAQFPDHSRPREAALALLDHAAKLPAGESLATSSLANHPASGFRPAGQPLVARDAYGSRLLLVATFTLNQPPIQNDSAHCYAWDIDTCFLSTVVAASAYGCAEDALADWREAVGPMSTTAELSSCPSGLAARLLEPVLHIDPGTEGVNGREPRALIREQHRLRRRAQELIDSLPEATTSPAEALVAIGQHADAARDSFLAWHASRNGDSPESPESAAEALDTLLDEWGPWRQPTEELLYACSPHRIELTALLLRDGYFPDSANQALELLPDWVQWCIEQSGITGNAAAQALAAARAEASRLATAGGDYSKDDQDRPYRRQE